MLSSHTHMTQTISINPGQPAPEEQSDLDLGSAVAQW